MQDQNMMNETESGGIDSIIDRVQGYIDDPKLVTPETLMELKGELEDLKAYMDGEDVKEQEPGADMASAIETMRRK